MPSADDHGREFKVSISELVQVLNLLMPRVEAFAGIHDDVIARRAAGDSPDYGDGTMFTLMDMNHHRRLVEAGSEQATAWEPRSEWSRRLLEAVWVAHTIEELVEIGFEHTEVCREILASGSHHIQVEPFTAIRTGLQRVRHMVEPGSVGLTRDGMVAEEVSPWPADMSQVVKQLMEAGTELRVRAEWPAVVPLITRLEVLVYPAICEAFLRIGDCFIASEELHRTIEECREIVKLLDGNGDISAAYLRPSVRRSRVAEMLGERRVRMVWARFDAYHVALHAFQRSRQRLRDSCARARGELERTERTTGLNADVLLKHLGSVGRVLPNHMSVGNVPPLDEETPVSLEKWASALDAMGEEMRHVAYAERVVGKAPTGGRGTLGGLEDAATALPRACFKLEGAMWRIEFGEAKGNWPDTVGLGHIAQLLARPNPVRALEALELKGKNPQDFPGNASFQPSVDADAASVIRSELGEYDRDIEEAKARGDVAGQESAMSARADFLKRIGDERVLGSSHSIGDATPPEKARVAVRQALRRIYQALRTGSPPMVALADHLQDSIKSEGTAFAYRPKGKEIAWDLGKTGS